jgi:ferredoxin
MVKYKIELINKLEDLSNTFYCSEDQLILDAAEENSIELPYSCRSGSCSTCLGKIIKGNLDQSNQNFLEEKQLKNGFVLLCVAYPTSDLCISTNEEENIY